MSINTVLVRVAKGQRSEFESDQKMGAAGQKAVSGICQVCHHPRMICEEKSVLPAFEPEAPNRFLVHCQVSGKSTQHATKVQAILGYAVMLQGCGCDTVRPAIYEWAGRWQPSIS